MDLRALMAAAEKVAYLGDIKAHGRMLSGMTVYWHDPSRRWIVHLPGYAGGVARAESLRKFTEGAIAALEAGTGDQESTLLDDGYRTVEVNAGVDADDGPYVSFWVWYDTKQDFIGVSDLGEPLYNNATGASYDELYVDEVEPAKLLGVLRTLLARLAAAPQASDDGRLAAARTITTFAVHGGDSSRPRLDIVRRPDSEQWLIALHPILLRPINDGGIRALALSTRQMLADRAGTKSIQLIMERRYRLEVTVGCNEDRGTFFVAVTVASPGKEGTENVLKASTRFDPVPEAQLRDLVTELLGEPVPTAQ